MKSSSVNLCPDVLFQIFSFLEVQNLIKCSLVNKNWNQLINCEHVWKDLSNLIERKERKKVPKNVKSFKEWFKYMYSFRWKKDPRIGPNCEVSYGGLELSTISTNQMWESAISSKIFEEGKQYFEIKILECNFETDFVLLVGVVEHSNGENFFKNGWSFICGNGIAIHNANINEYDREKYKYPLKVNDVIGVELNLEPIKKGGKGSIGFKVNGRDLGIAFNNISGKVCPAISVFGKSRVIFNFPNL